MLKLGAIASSLSGLCLKSDAAQPFTCCGIRWHLGRPEVRQVDFKSMERPTARRRTDGAPILPGDHKRHDFLA
jgi:hypothetical protein